MRLLQLFSRFCKFCPFFVIILWYCPLCVYQTRVSEALRRGAGQTADESAMRLGGAHLPQESYRKRAACIYIRRTGPNVPPQTENDARRVRGTAPSAVGSVHIYSSEERPEGQSISRVGTRSRARKIDNDVYTRACASQNALKYTQGAYLGRNFKYFILTPPKCVW